MPFQSEKQRKYLWANEPAIAKRWEKYPKGYNTGGVSHLFRSKEAAHGGYIRPEDSGVLGLADGGNIRLQPHTATDLLVKKTSSGERPKYQPPGHRDAPAPSSRGPRDDPDRGGQAPQRDPTPDRGDDSGGDYEAEQVGTPYENIYTAPTYPTYPDEGGERDDPGSVSYEDPMTQLIKKQEEEKKDYVAPQKKKSFLGTLATAIAWFTGLAPLLGLKVPAIVQTIGTGLKMKKQLDYGVKEYNKRYGTNYSFDEFIAKTTDRLKKEYAERQEKMALYKSLPDGHPEKIQLQIDLQIGKKPPPGGGDRDGDQGDVIDITYDDIGVTNDLIEKKAASKRQYDMLYGPRKEEDRSKQMAYWRAMMEPYMSAQGGRVPQGYNSGGLSNLFRLKNR